MSSLQSPPFRDRTISIARMTHAYIKSKYFDLRGKRDIYAPFYVRKIPVSSHGDLDKVGT